MSVKLFKTLIVAVTLSSIILCACKKEVGDSLAEKSSLSVLTNERPESKDKQERKILFVSNRDGNDEVYAMNLDGTNIMRLTYNDVPDGRASWSANGQHIAFASGVVGSRDIYVMNANGQALRNLTNTPNADEEWPEWSTTGNNIIFSSNREDGNHEIYVSNMGGNDVRRLTYRAQDDKWPNYSPDGNSIAFQSHFGSIAGGTDVFVMQSDGTNITRLTTNTPALDQMPAWSPDGSKLAFMSTRDRNPEIYVMNADGSNQTRLTTTPAVDGRPSWSREGNEIVFTSARNFNIPSTFPKFEIYKMNGNGSNQTRLTTNAFYDDFPYIK